MNFGEKLFQAKLLSRLSHKVCRLLSSPVLLRKFTNDDGDGNEDRKKSNRFRLAKRQLCTCITFFLYDYNVKVSNFMFGPRRKHKTRTFFFFSWTLIQSFRIQLKVKFANIWRIERVRNKREKVWRSTNSFFKWRFLGCCLRSLLYEQQRYKTGTSRSHRTLKILPERLVERVWGTTSQSSVDSSSRSYLSTFATRSEYPFTLH